MPYVDICPVHDRQQGLSLPSEHTGREFEWIQKDQQFTFTTNSAFYWKRAILLLNVPATSLRFYICLFIRSYGLFH